MSEYYKLDENKNAIPCTANECFSQREEMSFCNTKHVADEIVDGKRVSTVWLGFNHQYLDYGPPLIFETMIFADYSGIEIYMDRYSTWKEAEEGHKKAVEWVKNGCQGEDGE